MKITALLALSLQASSVVAFQALQPFINDGRNAVTSSKASSNVVVLSSTAEPTEFEKIFTKGETKAELLALAKELKDENGVIIVDTAAKKKLQDSVKAMEGYFRDASFVPYNANRLLGNWTLLCSTASPDYSKMNNKKKRNFEIDMSKLPQFLKSGPVKEFQDLLNKSLVVQQKIIASKDDGEIDRIDHVLSYNPPDSLTDFLSNVPDAFKNLNINPLQVTQSKVSLIHKASIESTAPALKTKLSLSSIVLNVAGKSQTLDPAGADVLGVNLPLGEFLNSGSFETTYVDKNLRISRSKVGLVDQLRVFVRSETIDSDEEDDDDDDEEDKETVAKSESDDDDGDDDSTAAPSDVED